MTFTAADHLGLACPLVSSVNPSLAEAQDNLASSLVVRSLHTWIKWVSVQIPSQNLLHQPLLDILMNREDGSGSRRGEVSRDRGTALHG